MYTRMFQAATDPAKLSTRSVDLKMDCMKLAIKNIIQLAEKYKISNNEEIDNNFNLVEELRRNLDLLCASIMPAVDIEVSEIYKLLNGLHELAAPVLGYYNGGSDLLRKLDKVYGLLMIYFKLAIIPGEIKNFPYFHQFPSQQEMCTKLDQLWQGKDVGKVHFGPDKLAHYVENHLPVGHFLLRPSIQDMDGQENFLDYISISMAVHTQSSRVFHSAFTCERDKNGNFILSDQSSHRKFSSLEVLIESTRQSYNCSPLLNEQMVR